MQVCVRQDAASKAGDTLGGNPRWDSKWFVLVTDLMHAKLFSLGALPDLHACESAEDCIPTKRRTWPHQNTTGLVRLCLISWSDNNDLARAFCPTRARASEQRDPIARREVRRKPWWSCSSSPRPVPSSSERTWRGPKPWCLSETSQVDLCCNLASTSPREEQVHVCISCVL